MRRMGTQRRRMRSERTNQIWRSSMFSSDSEIDVDNDDPNYNPTGDH